MRDQPSEPTRSRRNHDQGFNDDLVGQSLIPGASVSAIAMKGGINANLQFKWRREHVRAMAMAEAAPAAGTLLPVCVIPDAAPALNQLNRLDCRCLRLQPVDDFQAVWLSLAHGASQHHYLTRKAPCLLRRRFEHP